MDGVRKAARTQEARRASGKAAGPEVAGEARCAADSAPAREERARLARILDAAEARFAAHGFHGVSVQQIAQEAGVSKALVFHHFPNKRALYRAVVARACREVRAWLAELADEAMDPVQALRAYQQRQLAEMRRHEAVARLVLRELAEGNEELARDLAEEEFGARFRLLVSLVERARAQGKLRREVDARIGALAVAMIGVFLFLTQPMRAAMPEFCGRDVADDAGALLDVVLAGLGADGKGGRDA